MPPRSMQVPAFAALCRRLADFEASGDPAVLHTDDATAEAAEVVDAVRDGRQADGAHALAVAGQLFWRRHVTAEDPDQRNLHAATVLFGPIMHSEKTRVPEALWETATRLDEVSLARFTPVVRDFAALTDLLTGTLARGSDSAEWLGLPLGASLAMTPPGHRHTVLTGWLAVLYQRRGLPDRAEEMAHAIAPALVAVQRPGVGAAWLQSQVGEVLLARYGRSGDVALIDRAIDLGERAVELSEEDDSFPTGARHNLSGAYIRRFVDRFNRRADPDAQDLIAALKHGRAAVTVQGLSDPSFLLHAAGYAGVIDLWVEFGGDPAALDEAEYVLRAGLGQADDGHPKAPFAWLRLGDVAARRYRVGGQRSHRDEARAWYRRAEDGATADDPIRARARQAARDLDG